MHTQPPRTLKRLLRTYGPDLIHDPRRTEALLRDLCGQHTREIFVLVNAQRQRIPEELLAAPKWMPRQALYTRLSQQLQTKLALTDRAADWAVVTWAAALGLEEEAAPAALRWLPPGVRAFFAPRERHSRRRKRQNAPTGVQSRDVQSPGAQSNEEPTHKRRPRRAAPRGLPAEVEGTRAGLPWMLPEWDAMDWRAALPWAALITASLTLLGVIYWMARTPLLPSAAEAPAAAVSPTTDVAAQPAVLVVGPDAARLADQPGAYLRATLNLPTLARVSAEGVYLRTVPTTTGNVPIKTLRLNDGVEVVSFSDDGAWAQISQPQPGWVNTSFLFFQSQDDAHATIQLGVEYGRSPAYITEVRAAPRADAAVIASLAANTRLVRVAGTPDAAGAWVQIVEPTLGWLPTRDFIAEQSIAE